MWRWQGQWRSNRGILLYACEVLPPPLCGSVLSTLDTPKPVYTLPSAETPEIHSQTISNFIMSHCKLNSLDPHIAYACKILTSVRSTASMSCLWKRMARCTRVKPASNADGRLRIRTSSAVSWRAISPPDDLYASTAARSPSTTPDESVRYIWVSWFSLSQLFHVAVWISDSIPIGSIGSIGISQKTMMLL